MRKVKAESTTGVADRWRDQYFIAGQWTFTCDGSSRNIYKKLCALGTRPKPAEVAKVIGNGTWSHEFCSECRKNALTVVKFGNDGDGMSLCRTCLGRALRLLGKGR